MKRALVVMLILAGCASGASSDPDKAVLQAVVSDPHFEKWLATCEGPRLFVSRTTGAPAYEANDVPYFYTDAIPPDLLASLRERNRTSAPLPKLRYPEAARVDPSRAANLPVVLLSLPGYDAARMNAAVSVARGTGRGCLGAGYVAHLRRGENGVWRVDARIGEWVD